LRELRARRFTPASVVSFLAASNRRADEVRRARPELARRARRWELAGPVAWSGLALGGREPFRRRAVSGLAWWGLVAMMLEWHLGMIESEDGEPRNLGPADALTLARAFLVPVIADDLDTAALTAAAVSDVLDGVAARATVPTRAGRDLEGLVDAAVLAAALRCAHRTGRLSPAVIALELGRIAAGCGYTVAVYFARTQAPSRTVARAGRLTTPLRLAGLMAAGRGSRRLADTLLAAGSLTSILLLGYALRANRHDDRARPAYALGSNAPSPADRN
ncbi:MAG: CDP-alcohol phosphatidyltransferase family protein, partial [Solirubrobacterales bacterium]